MENNAPKHPTSLTTLPEWIRNRLADHALAHNEGAIRIVTAMGQNWPEITYLGIGELAFGDDGLIRCALWSASKCCATVLGTRRITLLLREGDATCEIRCLVMANASLATTRPLSGFLLKPVEILDGCASRNDPAIRDARRALERILNGAGESRRALLDAFPVKNDGENAPP
jgi:hypothetical protein